MSATTPLLPILTKSMHWAKAMQILVPRPWMAAPATAAAPTSPQDAGVPATPSQTAAPSDALKLLLGGAMMAASPEEVLAKLQAARPDVYED